MKFKYILTLMLVLFLIGTVSAATNWVVFPTSCPSTDAINFAGQDCTPEEICGDNSGTAQCFDTPIMVSKASNSTTYSTNNLGDNDGGFTVNCFATADASAPFCDNNGAYTCERNETFHGSPVNRNTVCVGTDDGGTFGDSAMGTCKTEGTDFFNCFGDLNCEATSSSNCNASTIPNTRYNTGTCFTDITEIPVGTATCGCDPGFFVCDGVIDDSDGCEIQDNAACSGGTGTIVADQCFSSSAGNCTSSTNSDCNDDDGDGNLETCNNFGDGCEIPGGGGCGFSTGTYVNSQCQAGVGNCTRSGTNLDCDDDDSDGNLLTCNGGVNGCEIEDGGACLVGDLEGTFNGCSCEIDDLDIGTTGIELLWSSATRALLWITQIGDAPVINATTKNGISFIVNSSGAYWNDINLNATGGGGGNSSWNQSFANTLYADISVTGGNESWNQSFANSLYAPNTTIGIQFLLNNTGIYSTFNATYDSNQANGSFNQTLTDGLYIIQSEEGNLNVNASVWWAGLTAPLSAWISTFNATYDSHIQDNVTWNQTGASLLFLGITDQRYNETQIILDSNFSWTTTFNVTYDSHIQDNVTWNQTGASLLYADISVTGDNVTWNQTGADLLYISSSNTTILGLINNESYLSTFNITYDTHNQNNNTFNQTLTDSLYLPHTGGGGGWQPNNLTEDNNYTTTGNVSTNVLQVDHIVENEVAHGIVFDNSVNMGSNSLTTTGFFSSPALQSVSTSLFLSALDDGAGKTPTIDFRLGMGGASGRLLFATDVDADTSSFHPDIFSHTVDLGTSTFKWTNLHLSGDANVGGNVIATGNVSSSNTFGTIGLRVLNNSFGSCWNGTDLIIGYIQGAC